MGLGPTRERLVDPMTEATSEDSHDPMCPYGGWLSNPDDCRVLDSGMSLCGLIRRVREDERSRSAI
jgi:hypothetical protein